RNAALPALRRLDANWLALCSIRGRPLARQGSGQLMASWSQPPARATSACDSSICKVKPATGLVSSPRSPPCPLVANQRRCHTTTAELWNARSDRAPELRRYVNEQEDDAGSGRDEASYVDPADVQVTVPSSMSHSERTGTASTVAVSPPADAEAEIVSQLSTCSQTGRLTRPLPPDGGHVCTPGTGSTMPLAAICANTSAEGVRTGGFAGSHAKMFSKVIDPVVTSRQISQRYVPGSIP